MDANNIRLKTILKSWDHFLRYQVHYIRQYCVYLLDVNECDNGHSECDSHATCENTEGDYTCTCNGGWLGDGLTCQSLY